MGILDQSLAELSDDVLDQLIRPELGDQLNFYRAVMNAKAVRKMAAALNQEDELYLPAGTAARANQLLQELDNQLKLISSYQIVGSSDPVAQRNLILSAIEVVRDSFAKELRPHIRGTDIELGSFGSQAQEVLNEAKAAKEEVEPLIERLRKTLGEVGSSRLSAYYRDQATSHLDAARNNAIFGGIALVFTLALAIILFASLKIGGEASHGSQWADLTRAALIRLFVLGSGTYMVAFFARNYRVHKHLQVTNEQKRNALDTYPLFAEAGITAESRDFVMAELVRAVFNSAETGFLDATPEKTIIDSGGNLYDLLLSRGGVNR